MYLETIFVVIIAVALLSLLVVVGTQRRKIARHAEAERSSRQQERELNAHKRWLRALGQATSDGFIFVNKDGHVVMMNHAARSFLAVEDGLGKPLREVGRSFDLEPLVQPVLSGQIESAEQILSKDERAFSVRVDSIGLAAEDGVLVRFDEITELQRLGRARRDFVANISHELRTPITSLQLLVETITNETLNDKKLLRNLLGKMHLQIDLLRQLTDELMDLALIESGQAAIKLVETQASDLVEAATEPLRPQAERKEIALHVAVDSDTLVFADAQGIRKVLGNLTHNAIKFTNPGGRVEIRAARDGENVQFSIKDTGIGIPPADLPRVFERFYKVDRARAREAGELRGTGLGLSIARHIVQAHGGKIWAESVQRQGSTFFFTLPAAN